MVENKADESCQSLTPLEKTQYVDALLRAITEARETYENVQKLTFTTLTEEEIRAQLNNRNTPYIYFQAWSGSAPVGGTISYTIGITNPDPVTRYWMYAHVFIGPANMVPDTGIALLNVDPRFPRLTEPAPFGITLAPGGSTTLSFSISIPSGVEPSVYLGNSFLFHGEYHGIGSYYFRCLFPFRVV